VLPDRRSGPTGVEHYWEVVADWSQTDPAVTASTGAEDTAFETMEILAENTKADCARLQRPYVDFTFSQGRVEWNAWEPAVTNEVLEMLSRDIQRIERWLVDGYVIP
jgi:hypothetical protein